MVCVLRQLYPYRASLSRYYSAFLEYFSEYLRDHAPNEAFERFVLSSPYNFDPDLPANDVQDIKEAEKQGNKHPEMLNRLMAGLLHPFIHLAYGIEFGLPGQVAEGLLCWRSGNLLVNIDVRRQASHVLRSTRTNRPS
jgi:Questin oxidase-like